MAVQTRPQDAQDGDGEQDGEGHIGADEGGGEGRSHDVEGRRGGMGQRSEEGGEGTGEGAEHEGVEAERPDAGAGLSVGHVSLPWLVCPVRGTAPSMHPLATPGLTDSIAGSDVSGGDVSGGGGGGVVGEPAVQGGAAQARERAGLGLLHGLARQPEAAADLL